MLASIVLLAFGISGRAIADDWPQWRGLNRDGVWHETGIMQTFPPKGLNVVWRAPTQTGYASPVVAQGRAYLHDVELKKPRSRERVRCWDALTGTLAWTHAYDVDYPDWAYKPGSGAGPNSTPIVHKGRFYAWGRSGDIFCLDAAKGDVIWKKNVQKEYQLAEFSGTPSPLIEGDLLILSLGGKPQASVVAFDTQSGKEVWKGLDEQIFYSSPIVIESGGQRQLIVWTQNHVVSLNPKTGEVFWKERFNAASGTTVSTPVFEKDRLLVAGVMLQLDASKPAAKLLWPKSSAISLRIPSNTSTADFHDGYVYTHRGAGELVCLDGATGEQVWSTDKVTDVKNGSAMQLIRNGDSYLIYTDRGELIRAKLTPQGYTELSRTFLIKPTYAFGGRNVTWSLAVFANGHVYARNDEEIVCAPLATKGK